MSLCDGTLVDQWADFFVGGRSKLVDQKASTQANFYQQIIPTSSASEVGEEQVLRVEVDGFGQAPLRAVLGNRGRRPFDVDYARFIRLSPRT